MMILARQNKARITIKLVRIEVSGTSKSILVELHGFLFYLDVTLPFIYLNVSY